MKKLRNILILFFAIILITGCSMKAEYNMEIKKDKSMDFAVIMAFDDELLEGMLSMEQEDGETREYTEEEKWAYIESSINSTEGESPEDYGFKMEKYNQDGYMGYKFVKNISNIDDISGDDVDFDINDFQNIENTTLFIKEGEKYKANFVLANENSQSAEGMDVMFDIKFVVTLPNKPIKHNATEISNDGKTLTWNLLEEQSKNVEFEFEVNSGNNFVIYIAIGAALLVIIVVAIILISRNKKNKQNNLVNNISTGESVNSQPQMQTNIGGMNQSTQGNPSIELLNQSMQNNSFSSNQTNND